MKRAKMAEWADLEAELARWRTADLTPRLWWRDDDAQQVTPDLETLLDQSDRHAIPVHLAVIPQGLNSNLAPRLDDSDHAYVLQHGLAHINHEPKGSPASEVGDTRALHLQEDDLRHGWDILATAGLPRLLRGFVPPWNRISDATRLHLPAWGYSFLSAYEGRGDTTPVAGLSHINAHLDPIRWKYNRVFRGEGKMLDMLLEHFKDRRANAPAKPVGFVTHHLQTPQAVWDFTDRLFTLTQSMWVTIPDMQREG